MHHNGLTILFVRYSAIKEAYLVYLNCQVFIFAQTNIIASCTATYSVYDNATFDSLGTLQHNISYRNKCTVVSTLYSFPFCLIIRKGPDKEKCMHRWTWCWWCKNMIHTALQCPLFLRDIAVYGNLTRKSRVPITYTSVCRPKFIDQII